MKRLSFSPLWKTLIDRQMSKTELRTTAGLSRTTITKMGKDESVTLDVIVRICQALDCAIYDVVEVDEESIPSDAAGN